MKLLSAGWVRNVLAVVAVATLATACGGGGGGSSGAAPASTSNTRFVTGAITGFGSVIVNGVHYESDSATVTLEGQPGTVGDLEVGEVVHIEATADAQGVEHAKTISQERLIQGTVQAVDLTASTLTVEGQLVQVTNETSFDASIPGRSLAGIAVGNRVEVHGFVDSTGSALATRVELADSSDHEIEVTGPITDLDTVARRFTIGTQVVDYSSAALTGFPDSGPAAGDVVEAQGTTLLDGGVLQADSVSREDGDIEGDAGDGAELEGLVTRYESPTDFDVSGHKVTTNGSTVFVGGSVTDLALDVNVEVEGTLDSSGTIVAAKIAFHHESTLRLHAPVEAVDAINGTLQVLGVTVIVTNDTSREDNEAGDHYFSLADLNVGDWVEISAYPDPAGSGKLVATRLERDEPADLVMLSGLADDLAAPNFTIAGVSVATTPDTIFQAGDATIGAGDFFATAAGTTVTARGSWSGTVLTATRVEIVSHSD